MPPGDDRDLKTIVGDEDDSAHASTSAGRVSGSMGDGDVLTPDVAAATVSGDPEAARSLRESQPLSTGFEVGRYVVLDRIGSGAMGDVYAAYDPELDRRIALKMLRAERRASETRRARLLREAQSIARLSHPNVIAVYDVGQLGDQLYLAMEFADGGTLTQWLRAGPHPWTEVLTRLRAAGSGLAAAHAAGVVHRDFKPDNVLLATDGTVKVADFGIARWAEGTSSRSASLSPGASADEKVRSLETMLRSSPDPMTRTGDMMGTPLYMAPEQHGLGSGDERSDQFAFCVTAWEALFGERPFRGSTVAALMTAKLEGRIEGPPDSTVPGWVVRAIRRGLAPNPNERWPSMEALVAKLGDDPVRRRRRWLGLAGVLAAGAVLGALPDWSSADAPDDPCPPSDALIADVWGSTSRAELVDTFEASALPWAGKVANTAADTLDAWSADWVAARDEACRATWVDHTEPADVLEAKTECLDYARTQLATTIDWLEEGSRERITNALSAVASIPSVEACRDVDQLGEFLAYPTDPEQRQRARALRDELKAFSQRVRTLDLEARRQELGRLMAEADALGLDRIRGRIRLRQAQETERRGDIEGARAEYEAIVWESIARDDDATAFEAAIELMWLDGYLSGDPAAGMRRKQAAEALLERLGRPDDRLGEYSSRLAAVYYVAGRIDDAIAAYETALDACDLETLSGRLSAADVRFNVASLMIEKGAVDEALRRYDELEKVWVDVVGPDHPELISIVANRAVARRYAGDVEGAIASGLRGRALCGDGTRGPAGQCADVESGLAFSLHDAGRLDEAVEASLRAYRRRAAMLGPTNPSAILSELRLVELQLEAGRLDEAQRQAEASRGVDADARWADVVLRALVAEARGQLDEAAEGLAIVRDPSDATEEEPLSAVEQTALLARGRVLLAQGKPREAITFLRALLDATHEPEVAVRARVAIARAELASDAAPPAEVRARLKKVAAELESKGRVDLVRRVEAFEEEMDRQWGH